MYVADNYRQTTSDSHLQIIPRWFYNSATRKNAPAPRQGKSRAKRFEGLGSLSMYSRPLLAHGLFAKDIKAKLNQETLNRQSVLGEDHRAHPKLYNQVLNEKWLSLPPEKKQEYEASAIAAQAALKQPASEDHIYQ